MTDWTNIIDWINVASIYALFVAWWIICSSTLDVNLADNSEGFTPALRTEIESTQDDLELIASQIDWYEYISFINMLVAVLCLVKNTLFQHQLGVLGRTLCNKMELTNLLSFAAVFCAINAIFALFTSTIFGRHTTEFKSWWISFFSLMRWFFGDFAAYDALSDAYRPIDSGGNMLLARIAFWAYIVLCFVMAQNILLAIVVNSYMDLWEEAKKQDLPSFGEEMFVACHYTRCCVANAPCYRCARKLLSKKKRAKATVERTLRAEERKQRRAARSSRIAPEGATEASGEVQITTALEGVVSSNERSSQTYAVRANGVPLVSKLRSGPCGRLPACSMSEIAWWASAVKVWRNLACFACDIYRQGDVEDALVDALSRCKRFDEGTFRMIDVERILLADHGLRPSLVKIIMYRLEKNSPYATDAEDATESALDATVPQLGYLAKQVAELKHEQETYRSVTSAKLDAILAVLQQQRTLQNVSKKAIVV